MKQAGYSTTIASEKPTSLPVELTRALIADFEGRTRGIELPREHLLTRCVKPKLFLKLQRAHGCKAAEVMVDGRSTHPGHRCKVTDEPPSRTLSNSWPKW
jgi:hypothetical protein